MATTQLRQALVELSKEGSTTDKIFRDLAGKSFQEFIASGGNLNQALQLLEKYSNQTGKSLKGLFSSGEAGDAVLQLTGKVADTFSKSLDEMATSANATNVAFGKMDINEARQFEKIKVQIQNLVIELGQKLMPIVRDDLLPLFRDTLIPVAQKIVETIGKLATAFNNLPPSIKNASFQFIGLVAIIGPAALAIVQMGNAFNTTRDAISGAQDVIKIAKSAFEGTKVALIAKNVALKASAIAWRALNLAINATPVGVIATLAILFAAVTIAAYKKEKADKAAYEAAVKHSQALTKSATETINLTTETNNLLESYNQLENQTTLTTAEQEEQRLIVEKLNELYPDLDIAYANNGRIIGNLTDMVYALNEARKLEETQAIASQKATVEAEISKRKSELDSLDARLKDKNSAENTGITGGLTLDHNKKLVENELANLELELEKLKEVETALKNTVVNTAGATAGNTGNDPQAKALERKIALLEEQLKLQNQNNNAGGGDDNNPPDKNFDDYLLDLENELFINDRKIEQLKEINKNYDDTSALQNRNAIITSAITQMATELELTEQQALKLGDTYGKAFDTEEINTQGFTKMRAEIHENIEAYENQIAVRRSLNEVIDESDVNTQKAEMTKQGILNIVIALKLTEEQVRELKEEFGDLFESAKVDSQTTAEWFKENWQRVFYEVAYFTNEMLGGVNDIFKHKYNNKLMPLK